MSDQAAVAPLEDFLEGETKRLIQTPMDSILPEEEWPSHVPKSYVRADDQTWEILQDSNGRRIVSGAGAVPRQKGDKTLQVHFNIC